MGSETEYKTELTATVSPDTADRLNEVAWSFGIGRQQLVERLCEKAAERAH